MTVSRGAAVLTLVAALSVSSCGGGEQTTTEDESLTTVSAEEQPAAVAQEIRDAEQRAAAAVERAGAAEDKATEAEQRTQLADERADAAEQRAEAAEEALARAAPAVAVQTIVVGGMGAEYGPPDHAVVDIGVEVRRASVVEASAGAASAAAAMVDALVAAGVPEADVQTSDFRVEPNHDPSDYLSIVGYSVHLGYRVTMPDVGAVGAVLADAVQAGGDSVRARGVRFGGDPAGLMETARQAAWADVSQRAASTAELAGEPLGEVLDVHEKVLVTTPQGMMQGGEGDSASFDIPVSPGRVGVVVLLTVTYAIGD